MTTTPLRITVWGENVHEQVEQHVAERYPDGMHGAIADGIREHLPEAVIRTATMQEPEHGLTDEVLADTDVLTWWGHAAHQDVDDAVVDRVHRHVLSGMGLLVLHSGHWSKIFGKLMGTTCTLRWRSEHDQELVWTVNPQHPITRGVPNPIVIPEQEMYGEYFDVPTPDELVFISGFTGGEVFRSGMTYRRGLGKIFYFSPGDQDFPVYHHPDVRRVIANGAEWARPEREREMPTLRRYDLGEYFDGQHYRGPFDDAEPETAAPAAAEPAVTEPAASAPAAERDGAQA
ncbi:MULTISPECIES: ThuA domain-containing protein [Curtobacterium]|uniref:ThuA domain-containing protein n=2 Tax=Curtobacterium TaxID=2034 RepID=A0A9Q2ZM23_9MICO|nr:ThuA domain-containing protein [Curtobacterium flaccumfaciens]MBT1541069.1 ThuA domain-containing protein [Curtobacterium flaccumfaciens pv. flaccumfaciens]MBT1611466.1 ThuA domain-containing protein [Curtobacterium flaccumfaciens pv. poinsettiae]MCX2848750.1 ThuA domain-containing protein [Curtobacterium flaccumfaciens pv. poinsettiae]UXN19677.1 ThuA domain-containing protein [Curtobacterium flaccumfaciens pv. poinsettiae]